MAPKAQPADAQVEENPRARARATYVRVTPMKARRVIDLIRGLPTDEALTMLRFAPQAASEPPAATAPPADSNAELAKRVEFELYRTNAFNTSTMQVRADDGAVTLAGTVRSRAEQLLAERVVQSVSGVKKVTNELKVTASPAKQ